MNEKVDSIIDQIKTLTLLEAADLVAAMEETFGVDTSVSAAPVMMASSMGGAESGESVEEQSAFDITLTDVPVAKKIAILKIVRTLTGLGLKESKEIVDNVPKLVKQGVTKEEAEASKKQLEEAGATVTLK
jgi:large subunit ribosomal protein L7/L12